MTSVDVFDDYLDELYHMRDLAYDNEEYDKVREINVQLSKALNVEVDDIDTLDDNDEENELFVGDEEYIFEELDGE